MTDGGPRRVTRYINEAMALDHKYIQNLYGRVNPSMQKDYDWFWESPWVEEHIRDTNKRRRMQEQQKALTVRSFIKGTMQLGDGGGNMKEILDNINTLQEWEDNDDHKVFNTCTVKRAFQTSLTFMSEQEGVKSVSRVVHSFELKGVRRLLATVAPGGLRRPIAMAHLCRLCGSAKCCLLLAAFTAVCCSLLAVGCCRLLAVGCCRLTRGVGRSRGLSDI